MFSLRAHAIFSGGLLALIIALAMLGNGLQASGLMRDPERLELPAKILFFGLFVVFAFSCIPLMLKLFAGGQRGIGNADLAPAFFLAQHATRITVGAWLFLGAGLTLAVPVAIDDGAFGRDAQRAWRGLFIGGSQGELQAKPGMTLAEMAQASSVKIAGRGPGGSLRAPVAGDKPFDFRIPGSGILLPGCRYYFVSTFTRDPQRIQGISIGVSPYRLTRTELEAADSALQAKFAADGWLSGLEEYRTAENQRLHGGAKRGPEGGIWLKDGVVVHIERRRMDEPRPGEPAAMVGEWTQTISLWGRDDYPGIEFLVFAPPVSR